MHPKKWLRFSWFFVVAALFVPGQAKAWKCSRVPDNSGYEIGASLSWSGRQLTYSINAKGTNQLPQADTSAVVAEAFATWQNVRLRFGQDPTCANIAVAGVPTSTDVTFTALAPTTQDFAGYNHLSPEDNVNAILFRDDDWAYPLVGDTSDLKALTTTTYNPTTGEILDADIEVNTHDFFFSTSDNNVAYDLLNTMTHEVGHFLGFAHSDDANATMYSSTERGETSKRQLTCDDAAIMWYRYPAGQPTNACAKNAAVNQACGFCAPPGVIYEVPTMKVTKSYDGFGGCNCQSGASGIWTALPLGVLGLRRLRRRRMSK